MSHGVMKKPQPFTIATRLSVPKYGNSSTSGPCAAPPDIPRMLPHLNLPHCGPQNCLLDSDHYCAPESLERSVRKITLSKHEEGVCSRGSARSSPPALNLYRKEAGLTRGVARRSPPGLNIYSEEGGLTMGDARGSPPALILQGNSNNNNSRGLRHLSPDAADYLCDGTRRGTKGHKPASAAPSKRPSSLSPSPQGERKAPPNGIGLDGNRRAFAHNETLQTAQPWQDNTEQGESRFQGQLQYPSNQQIWLCPEQGDTGEHHTSRIRLNQMGDHLTSTGSTRAQLQSLRDQWQLLKQSATNHSKAVGGAKGLQEFNKKADELEIWMRQKEENPTLSVLLDENLDKVQLTRRILDLKQEQLYYSTLQESLNCVAQQLEKQGGPETRGTANRRKHLNRMWLRLQGTLSDYQRSLQLALEGASLWQQADTTLRAMEEKGKAAGSSGYHAQDLRDIARQIMMLDIAASQVSSLHPMLASRVQQKQRQVKEIWTQLQQSLRTGKFPRSSLSTRDSEPPLTPDAPEQNCVGTQQQCMLGSQTVVSQWPNSWEHDLRDISPSQTGVNRFAKSPGDGDDSPHGRQRCPPSSDKAEVDGLHSELNSTSQWLQSLEHLLSEPASMRSPELLRRDLRQASVLEKELKSRSAALQSMGRAGRSSGWDEEAQVRLQEVEERCQTVQDALRRRVSDLRDTLVLSEFMKVVQKEEERRKREALESSQPIKEEPDSSMILAGRKEVFTPLEELQEAVEMLNDAVKERERALAVTKETTNLEEQLSAVSRAVQSASRRGRDLRRKMEEAEQDYIAVKKQAELRDLQEISDLQEQMEADVLQIQAEVTRLEGHRDQLQTLCPQRSAALGRSMEEGLQAWARLQEDIQRNRSRLCRTAQLREFTLSYLGMISWTEETRTRILSDRPEERLSPAWREGLERSIDSKMKEFEKLASVGWKLIGEDRQLAQMIKERLEELQGMLSWVLMRWRCQKHQSIMGNKAQRMRSKEVAESTQPEEDGVLPPHKALQPQEAEHPADEAATPDPAPPPLRGPVRRRYRRRALSPILFQQPLRLSEGMDMEDGAELQDDGPRKCAGGPLWLEPKALPIASDMAEMEEEEPLVVPRKLDYQLMEGSLEKKCILQPGGKKASYRTWGMFHAVLVRRTLCFYHDRKHSTKSPVSAPPLHLTDAVCTPESDYTKRNNCFRLRLQDGSEYLFRALTASLLQEWVCKLRHNAALQDSGQLRETSLMGTRSPPDTSRGDPRGPQIPELCQPVPIRGAGEQRMKLHQEEPLGTPAKGIRADAHHRRSPPPDTGDSEFDVSLTASRRRSRSFSSVMYQKMASFSAPQDPTPSYSVTLYLDEPLLPRGRCHSFAAPQVTRHSADLKPRNKSVFRKLFWKKE
ncbi:spectrin beta chain, non-erythrocytic 5-like isoform X6 [Hyperolius riggenbachi]|uniref:spectrin beta chain, non-erythrocytic 5-like isoform X6 n=1 Tax=Hyperolius riggenbachi TaxID=752182 RepID=UPI0035A39F6B